MDLNNYTATMLPSVERDLKGMVNAVDGPGVKPLRDMLAYHMGWEGKGAGADAAGKRIRPLVTKSPVNNLDRMRTTVTIAQVGDYPP